MVGLNKSWGYSYLNASLFDDLQAIPDGSRDSLTRKFTKQITDSDTYRPIVSQSELNSYAIPVLHQHVQLYRIYDNSNFRLGKGNLLVNLGWQYNHRREFTHPTAPEIPGLNLELHSYTYDIKYNFTLGDGYDISTGINGMYQNNAIGYSDWISRYRPITSSISGLLPSSRKALANWTFRAGQGSTPVPLPATQPRISTPW